MLDGASIFPKLPEDAAAFVFTPERFGACPDGTGDNTAAMQAAVDELERAQEYGILFIPEGSYRFAGTVELWRGIRLIGFGAKRPLFFLADSTAGFEGPDSKYIFHFRDRRPKPGAELRDAQNTSFYGGIRNINFDLGHGNKGAVAVRFRIAQLNSLEDIDFHCQDAKAAVEMVGNEIERCRFYGGQYGILTGETVPYWQFYLGDSLFDGQEKACISSYRAGLTMVRVTLKNAPYGVYVPNKERDNHYIEEFERLYMEDCRMESLGAGVSMNMVRYPQNWFHGRGIRCKDVPTFLDSFGYQYNMHIMVPSVQPELEEYRVEIDMGLKIRVDNRDTSRRFDFNCKVEPAEYTPVPEPDYVPMPPQFDWVNIRDFGAKGDGIADDTEAFERAIAGHQAIYLPSGHYRLTRGLTLKEDTALIGLHCFNTRLVVDNHTPGFDDPKCPASMLTIPAGGHNHVCGISFDGGANPGLTSVEWKGAPDSILEDVLFLHGGHGGVRKGRDRFYTIWVHDGGAGVFKNIWSPDVWAKDGFHVNDTEAPGKLYLVSVEHHLDVEVVLERVANWRLIALQTEENLGSEYASSVYLKDCFDVEFANLFQYRVQAIDIQHPYASHAENCKNLKVNGIHVFSIGPTPFSNAFLVDGVTEVRDLEIGTLEINS
ncbi:MAG: glycosyl hydrolase family 28-related protein [Oscillospiraceae bacterium]|jgi:hypothetical protein